MSFKRYNAFITPRALNEYERENWRRKDGSARDCILVYNLEIGFEIPKGGAIVAVTNREHQYAYARMARDKSIVIRDVTEADVDAVKVARAKLAKAAKDAKAAKAAKADKKTQAPAASSGSSSKKED